MKSLAISLFLLCGLSGVSEGKEEERNCRVVYPDRPRDAPERVSPDAPSVEIPEDHTDLVLLVLSDPDNRIAPVRMEAVNLSDENFKIGRTLWMNRTDKAIEAKLGDQALSLDPVGSKIVEAPLSDKGVAASGYYAATFTYQAEAGGAFAPITEQQWWHDANSRHLGFITDTGGKLPRIYYFRDFRLPQE
jgi:hypothetical protein